MVNFTAGSVLTASALNTAFNAATINAQTGSSYTFGTADAGELVTLSNASGGTATIPANSTWGAATGTIVSVMNVGTAGSFTISGGTAVTVNAVNNDPILAPLESAILVKLATNTWHMVKASENQSVSDGQNLLYNGAMQVAQRGTSTASITTSGYYTADRWNLAVVSQGTWTNSIENDAPTGSGLRKSFKVLCTTADAAPAASDLVLVAQLLEGQDLQRVAKGTASAQQLTLSFWVKANVTGTYICDLIDADNSRQVSASYSVSASATWEKKSITFPADTTGAFDNDNALSLRVRWWLGAGTDYTSGTLATSWASTVNANAAVGQTNVAAATNNYWQITGVQLEVGPVASSFEFKSFGQELRECQRYYQIINGGNGWNPLTTLARFLFPLSPRLRANPTAITLTQAGTYNHPGGNGTPTALTLNTSLPAGAFVDADVTGLTANQPGTLYNAIYGISAEL